MSSSQNYQVSRHVSPDSTNLTSNNQTNNQQKSVGESRLSLNLTSMNQREVNSRVSIKIVPERQKRRRIQTARPENRQPIEQKSPVSPKLTTLS